jgi:hypothetical protein
MDEESKAANNSQFVGGLDTANYAHGAFYADELDTFVAGASPPSSPTEIQNSVIF